MFNENYATITILALPEIDVLLLCELRDSVFSPFYSYTDLAKLPQELKLSFSKKAAVC